MYTGPVKEARCKSILCCAIYIKFKKEKEGEINPCFINRNHPLWERVVNRRGHVMVNFMCHFGWTTVPRYSVKRYSGCFYKSMLFGFWLLVFLGGGGRGDKSSALLRSNKLVDLSKALDYPP